MRRILLAGALVMAVFTGRQETVTTVTGKVVNKCWYQYNGQYFYVYVPFQTQCPMTVEVE